MSKKNVETPPALTESDVVAKVAELMETLDQVKKYNALSSSLKHFALIIVSSVAVFLAVGGLLGFLNLLVTFNRVQVFFAYILLLLIPVSGVVTGVFFIRKRVNSTRTGEWKEELSQGFPSALKILMELDWDDTFDRISRGRFSYALYGVLKAIAYWIITFFALRLVGNLITFIVLRQELFSGPVLILISLVIVYLLVRNDFSKRFAQIMALDKLLWELRWFSVELRRAEF
ncbi:MAG: hypothetical protein ACBZ72_03305 [Candidatus Bathyarchaeia archaeon]|jgi:hypothetical protein